MQMEASVCRWLDKLGQAAKLGIMAVFRQTLYGGSYALLTNNLKPSPVSVHSKLSFEL